MCHGLRMGYGGPNIVHSMMAQKGVVADQVRDEVVQVGYGGLIRTGADSERGFSVSDSMLWLRMGYGGSNGGCAM
jgi:hypothetical protein